MADAVATPSLMGAGTDGLKRVQHAEGANIPPNQKDTNQQANIANPSDNECFLCRFPSLGAFVPETNQQIRTDANQLPSHVEQQEIVG